VHRNGREVTLAQKPVELGGTDGALDEDDDLVVHQLIEQVVETSVLLGLGEADVVLLKTVQCELGLVIDVNLEGVLHELLAHRPGLGGERGRKHHDLFLSGSRTENFLHIAAHVCDSSITIRKIEKPKRQLTNLIEHLVTFV
jgi:hypothetical protein